MKNPLYVFLVLGNCAFVFNSGGGGFWVPFYLEEYFGVEPYVAIALTGGVTLICGTASIILGSYFVDKKVKKERI